MAVLLYIWLPFVIIFVLCRIRSYIKKGRTLFDWYMLIGILIAPIWFFGILFEEMREYLEEHDVLKHWSEKWDKVVALFSEPV